MTVIRKEIVDLCGKGVMRRISLKEVKRILGFYSKMFCVPKPGQKWRPVINLRPFNEFVIKEKFCMETVCDV